VITAREIEDKAKEFEIHTSNVQRDYVFGWLLYGFFTISGLKNKLFLKGGNALRKAYFAETRYSPDLDFGLPDGISKERLLEEINGVCDGIGEKSGVSFVRDSNKVEEKFSATDTPLPGLQVLEARVYFKDFYGNSEYITLRISMDITLFDRVMLPLQTRSLIHPYSDGADVNCSIRCMKLEEIIATKLKCLMQRQHAPDLFDYAYTIRTLGGELNKTEVVQTLIRKTIFSRNPFTLKTILATTAFGYFREQWQHSIICAKAFVMDVESAIKEFVGDLDVLFASYPDTGFAAFAYFPAAFRAPIMEAARTQTMLRIRYKGEERMVEPYSLKYQQRRDGVAREYFFAFKVSGGESGPGMRSFVPNKMQSIENTDTKFSPRYQIELSKAGEMPEDPYLFDPNKPLRAPSRRPRAPRAPLSIFKPSGPTYVFRCGVCGRTFRKKSYDSTLGSHKGKNGYPCYGTWGVYVTTKY
jgi:predicted nucleotidyltransferase component of viral defense system